jgi:transposase
MECWVLNAQHMHNVPGRKTDVADSVWIAQLVEHGLVRPSFIPPPPVRDLRDLTRLRTAITQERTRAIQRLEKVFQDAGIKLTSVASQTYSKTGRAIMSALINGVSDPVELAALAKGRLKSKTDRLVEALANRFRVTHHGVLAGRLLAHIDILEEQLVVWTRRSMPESNRSPNWLTCCAPFPVSRRIPHTYCSPSAAGT